jgi:hypothetical protein
MQFDYDLSHEDRFRIFYLWHHVNAQIVLDFEAFQDFGFFSLEIQDDCVLVSRCLLVRNSNCRQ